MIIRKKNLNICLTQSKESIYGKQPSAIRVFKNFIELQRLNAKIMIFLLLSNIIFEINFFKTTNLKYCLTQSKTWRPAIGNDNFFKS